VPDGTPKDTAVTASRWLTESVDRALRRSFRRNLCDLAIDYLIQRSMVSRYVVPEYNDSPWVVVHGDLHNDNIIIDDEFNIQGYETLSPISMRPPLPLFLPG
jgi:aminoglycoside phosphotransferase (APT) family kinase protein